MSVFPLKFRNSAFWKAFILYHSPLVRLKPLSCLSWWKANRKRDRFRAWEFLGVTAGEEFADGTCGVLLSPSHPPVKGNITGYSVHLQEGTKRGIMLPKKQFWGKTQFKCTTRPLPSVGCRCLHTHFTPWWCWTPQPPLLGIRLGAVSWEH